MKANSQDLMQQHWDDVRVFLAIHRTGSLGKASARLNINISTTSRRLTALENAMGARLFERNRDGLAPTAVAAAVLPAAEAMESALYQFARNASGIESAAEGIVRISGAPGFVDAFIAPALVRLRSLHPRIHVELDASVRVLDLERHEADLALRSVRPEGANLVVTKVATAPWVVAASKALTKKLGNVTAWDALPWITWDHDLASFPPARWVQKHAAKAEVVLRTSHFASQITAARSGLGVLLLPTPYFRVYPLHRVRVARELATSTGKWLEDDLWLVAHRTSRELPRVAAVWQFLLEELREKTAPPATAD